MKPLVIEGAEIGSMVARKRACSDAKLVIGFHTVSGDVYLEDGVTITAKNASQWELVGNGDNERPSTE